MPTPLTREQCHQLRADLTTTADHLDSLTPAPDQPPALPVLYTLLAPAGPDEPVRLRAEPIDPGHWRLAGHPWIGLASFATALGRLDNDPGVYGYALAYTDHLDTADSTGTPCVILAVGRDGEVFLAGTGSPGPHYRDVAHGLEQLVLAVQEPDPR
jgi:hypothetical protein